jgi:probable HAF family extracellular repeat protein
MAGGLRIGQRRLLASIRGLVLGATVFGAMSVLAPGARAAGTLTDLGSLQAGCGSTAVAINDHGQVAGTSCSEPFRWTATKGMQGLGFISSLQAGTATAMNLKGDVVGSEEVVAGQVQHGFRWTPTGGIQDLTPSAVGGYTFAQAINSSGEVAFTSWGFDGSRRANLWTHGAGSQDLIGLSGITDVGIGAAGWTRGFSCCISAGALNNRGDLTGESAVPGTSQDLRAYLYTPTGGTLNLGTLPGDSTSAGVAVNNRLDVAGNSEDANGVMHAFLWTPGSGMQELMLPGSSSSDAVGINNRGQVIGFSQLPGGAVDAFLSTPGDPIRDLGPGKPVAINQHGQVAVAGSNGNAYRWTASTGRSMLGPGAPTAINDHGQVVGNSTNGDAFLWTPASRG